MSKDQEAHIHVYEELTEQKIPLRKYTKEKGRPIADVITAVDTMKLRKCKCGKAEPYDIERKLA